MRQLNRLAAGTAVVAFAAFAGVGLAQADGMPGKRVVYEKPWDWGGLYFGVHAGWQWSDMNATIAAIPTQHYSISRDSPLAGGQIGLQHQFGNIVLGIEGGFSASYRTSDGVVTCPNSTVNCASRFDDVLTIGPRIGWAMGKWMPYVTGGYANAAFAQRTVSAAGVTTDWDRERHSGWYIGGGVDMALSHGWTVGLEYRHYEFDEVFHTAFTPAGVPVPLSHTFVDPSTDTFTIRASWKLGRPERVVPLK